MVGFVVRYCSKINHCPNTSLIRSISVSCCIDIHCKRQGVILFGLVSQRYTRAWTTWEWDTENRKTENRRTILIVWQKKKTILRTLEKEIFPSFVPIAFSVMKEVMWLYVLNNTTFYRVSTYKTDSKITILTNCSC